MDYSSGNVPTAAVLKLSVSATPGQLLCPHHPHCTHTCGTRLLLQKEFPMKEGHSPAAKATQVKL